MYERLGEVLETLCRTGRNDAVLVAPFIKRPALARLFSAMPAAVRVLCVTRWRPKEIAANVSDPDIWLDIQQRDGAALRLCPSLHAKYYRIDETCLIGSANVTNAALSWSAAPNLEILHPLGGGIAEWQAFERQLTALSIPCREVIYQEIKATAALLKTEMQALALLNETATVHRLAEAQVPYGSATDTDTMLTDLSIWLPQSRQPADLFLAYTEQWALLTSASRSTTLLDLAALQIPRDLNHKLFMRYVSMQLLQMPCVAAVDTFVTYPQRFGSVRSYIASLACSKSSNFDATRVWQTLMRWLLYFIPERYEYSRPHHSEVFRVRK